MHLVNWETLKRPILEGGLQIRDPELANLALGGKLVWQLFSDKHHPVSMIFQKKYLKGGSLRNIKIANTPTGTAVWNLCRKGFDNIQCQLYRIPGSEKKTFLWEDKILGNLSLSSINSLSEFKIWLTNKGFLRLADICNWDSNGIGLAGSFLRLQSILLLNKIC